MRAKEIYYREKANTTGAAMSVQPNQSYSDVLQQNAENRLNNNQNNNNLINDNNKNKSNNNNNKNNSINRNINNNNNENNNNNNKNNNEAGKNINQMKINNNNNTINNNSKEQTIETRTQHKETTENVRGEPTVSRLAAANMVAGTATQHKRYSFLNPNELRIALEDDRMGE